MEGGNSLLRGHIILCLDACKMISKGCDFHIVRVKDLEYNIPFLKLIPLVKNFRKVFSDELPGIPPKQEIDFSIDL